MKTPTKQYPIYNKSIGGVVTILALSSFILIRGTKDKEDFYYTNGKITSIDKTYSGFPDRHQGKFRYLSIEHYPKVFELFVGKDFGDFKPHYERIDDLKMGDTIDVYFDEDSKETDTRLNRLIQFIDKDGEPYYIRGSKDKIGGYFFITFGVLLGGLIIYLKKIGKII